MPRQTRRLAFDRARNHFDWAALAFPRPDVSNPPKHVQERSWETAKAVVRRRYASLLCTSPERVYLFSNTTAAIQRILLRLQQVGRPRDIALLTTDLEYPGVMAMLDESWAGPVYIAAVEQLIWRGGKPSISDTLIRAFLLTRPEVVLVSHVSRGTGYVLPADFLAFVRQIAPRTVLLVDGAQAIGNLAINYDVVNHADFYVTSGHKWLGGKATLGLVIADRSWELADPGQSYTRREGSAGTGDKLALDAFSQTIRWFFTRADCQRSAMDTIAENTQQLAHLFAEELQNRTNHLRVLAKQHRDWEWNGIVAVTGSPEAIATAESALSQAISQKQEPIFPRACIIKHEQWRTVEGAKATGRRYLVDATERDRAPNLRRMPPLNECDVPLPRGPYIRLAIHGLAHTTTDVERLADVLASAHSRD